MKREAIAQNLQRSILFQEASEAELATFAEVARVQTVPEGQYVYRQEDTSEVFYVIAKGEVEFVLGRIDGGVRIVGRVGVGGHFGETGILTGKPRSLSVRALSDLVVICFDKRFFRNAFLSNSRIHKQLDAALAERLKVAFPDQVEIGGEVDQQEDASEADDVILFKDRSSSVLQLRRLTRRKDADSRESKSARKIQAFIDQFAANSSPFILTGEAGTGKKIIAHHIHLKSRRAGGQYREVDLREIDPPRLGQKLFGMEQEKSPFTQLHQTGLLEQTSGGTVVFTHVHLMKKELQEKLAKIIESKTYTHVDSNHQLSMQSRIIFLSNFPLDHLKNTEKLIPELLILFGKQHFNVPPLRDHKEDLPRLVSHYLGCHSREYGKNIQKVTPETLGIFMNYDWPGNLTELSSVIRRAVMLAEKDEINSDQVLLGLPKTEGKWEYNILRIAWVRKFLESKVFPRVPQVIISCVLLITVVFLFLGPSTPEANLGLTLGWYIGWPLMFFSFFFSGKDLVFCMLTCRARHIASKYC